jgi:TM2 domain-containing membrane protein YozV
MKKLIVSLIAVLGIAISANAANYKVDNNAIDALVENATEVYTADFMVPASATAAASASVAASGSVNPVTALILNVFLGWCAIHRHYCGTAPWMWAAYLFTGGGIFGILDLVDFVMLIVGIADGSGASQFINNPKFIAWI